jgi:molybdopterin-guanine dinucleotide biosynthesis protein MobB
MVNSSPVICIVAPGSGYGKTSLLEYLIRELKASGKSVCVLKHSGHNFVPDEGKDTLLHRRAGAMASAVLTEDGLLSLYAPGSSMEESLRLMGCLDPDVVLSEGFKGSAYPKIILLKGYDEFGILPALENVIAVLYEGEVPDWVRVPVVRRKEDVLDIVLSHLSVARRG